jgi:hypothetical protein
MFFFQKNTYLNKGGITIPNNHINISISKQRIMFVYSKKVISILFVYECHFVKNYT